MMMMIFFKIIADLLCGVMFSWGGFSFLAARRFIMPSILAISVGLVTHIWWLGLSVLPVIGTLHLSYKNQKWLGRGFWLALQAFVIALVPCITGHLEWFLYPTYVICAFGAGALLYNIEQTVGDMYFGCFLGCIIFFLK